MFANRLVRNIFIFFVVFVLTIQIYYWSIAIQFGEPKKEVYVGFYTIFSNFEQMPRFETFVDTLFSITDIFEDMSGWEIALSVITLGTYTVAKFCWYIIQILVALFGDVVKWFAWIFGFFGIKFN